MTPRRLAVLFPDKEIPDWVAHPVQSGTAAQRAPGGGISRIFWGRNEALMCDIPTGVRAARSLLRRTVATRGCTGVTLRQSGRQAEGT
jgi:hypothetical protein